MKKLLILLALFSLNAWSHSADYVCSVRSYRVDLFLTDHTSSHVWVSDDMRNRTITHGYAYAVEKKGDKSIYHFQSSSGEGKLDLIFKTQDANDMPRDLVGQIDTVVDGFPLWSKLTCRKK